MMGIQSKYISFPALFYPRTLKQALAFIICISCIGTSKGQLTVVEWNFPGAATSTATIASTTPNNTSKTLITVGGTAAVGYGSNTGAYTQSAWCSGWAAGSGSKWWEIEFSTLGLSNLDVSSKQRSSPTGPRDFKIQYKVGALGVWTDLTGATAIVVADNFTLTSSFVNQVQLPAACNDQASVYLRWIMTSNVSVSAGVVAAGGSSRIDELVVNSNAVGYFRSQKSGSWKDKTTWEYSADNITWIPADTLPTYGSKTITIKTGHVVTIDTLNYFTRSANLRVDEVVVENGSLLVLKCSHFFINDGPGVDMQILGTLKDSLPASGTHYLTSTWAGSSSWSLGAAATFIKNLNSAATPYQNNYESGIVNVPATANWILQKTSTTINPSMTTANMYYPNFVMENISGVAYNANTVGANFVAGSPCIVKGNFLVNSTSALNSIAAYDSIYANSLTIQGNTTINQFGSLTMRGDSLHFQGNLTVNGALNYQGTLLRKIIFSGTNAQLVTSAAGTISIYNCEIRKASNAVTLNKDITIDNNLNFITGILYTTATPNGLLILNSGCSATGASNASYVNGPCRKIGNTAFTFPVGKNNLYRQCSLGAGAAGGTVVFWTENFNNGCTSLCEASLYTGPNGPWSVTVNSPLTDCGLPVTDNIFYISCAENGVTSGSCGTGCGGDATLHVGNDPASPSAPIFCPTGDCGAAYDAGGYCGDLGGLFGGTSTKTDIRAESPVIDCTGRTSINLAFRYIEQGTGSTDNATLWYYNGVVWAQLADMPKTLVCGSGQGRWTQYSTVLPASADNNPNVRIGFKWVNDDLSAGATDPSFAVDSVTLSVTGAVDIFTAEYFLVNPQLLSPCLNNLDPGLSAISCGEYWQIDRQQGTTARYVTLSCLTATNCGLFTLADLRVARCNGVNLWENRGNSGTTGTIASGTVTSGAPINNFSPFTLSTVPTPLPITIVNAWVEKRGTANKVSWQTIEEEPGCFFELEHAEDPIIFSSIGLTPGFGRPTLYSQYDYSPYHNATYYRIKTIYPLGKNTYSKIISVGPDHAENGYVNFIMSNELNIAIDIPDYLLATKSVVRIVDFCGRQIISQQMDLSPVNLINTKALSKGIYVLWVTCGDKTFAKKFSVN